MRQELQGHGVKGSVNSPSFHLVNNRCKGAGKYAVHYRWKEY